ncbi:unnamed protein product [Urochloa humidicola]
MSRIGDPATRPNEASFLVPTSFDLEQELKEWEGTTLIVTMMSAPPSNDARNILAVVLDEMQLQQGEVTDSRHQPEPFPIKLNDNQLAEKADKMSRHKHYC